ncbi:alpha/beta hydrolase [bacterium]|nr:alpha/beta hydrolase [bacterium]
MPSLRSRMFVFVLKHRHLLKLQRRRTNVGENTPVAQLREEVERGADFFGKLPPGFSLDPVDIGGLEAEWMLPPEAGRDRAVLYFHGGGLVMGSIRAHRGIVSRFVKGSGVPALVINYALAPERPFPAGLNDAVKAYEYLLSLSIDPTRIVFMGDSGGGNLCLATLLACKERNLPLPGGAVALSPWTDLTNSSPSYILNAEKDTLCWPDAQRVFAGYYTAGQDANNPLISPVFGDLSGLPPLLLYAGGDELLRDDAVRFAEKAEKIGVDVTLHVGEGLFHCYPAVGPLFPEAKRAMEEICEFIRSRTGREAG